MISLYIYPIDQTVYLSHWSDCIFIPLISLYIYPIDQTVYLSHWLDCIFIPLIRLYIYLIDQTVYLSYWSDCMFIPLIRPYINLIGILDTYCSFIARWTSINDNMGQLAILMKFLFMVSQGVLPPTQFRHLAF